MAYEGEYCKGSILSAATVIGSYEQEEEILRRYAEAPEQSGRLIGQGNPTRLYYGTKAQCTRNRNRRRFQGSSFDEKSVVLIGEGSFGNVYEVTHESLNKVAVKIFKGTNPTDSAWRELDTLILLRHQSVVNILGACVMGFPCIVLEYCLGSLKDLRPSMKQAEMFQAIIHTAEGLKFIHSKRYVHADLKPPNILINSNGRAVIADLGAGFFLDEGKTHIQNSFAVGTYPYMNVEALGRHIYSLATDLWSFGCIIYEMETQTLLIKTPKKITEEAYIDFIKNGWLIGTRKVRWEDKISQCTLHEVLRKLLSTNPISAEEFLEDPLIRALPTAGWDKKHFVRLHGKGARRRMDDLSFVGKPFLHTELEVANFYYDPISEMDKNEKRKMEPVQARPLQLPSRYELKILMEQKEIFRQMLQSLVTGNRNEILRMKVVIQDVIRAGIGASCQSPSPIQQSLIEIEPENSLQQSNLDLVPSVLGADQYDSLRALTLEPPGMDMVHTSQSVPSDMEIVEHLSLGVVDDEMEQSAFRTVDLVPSASGVDLVPSASGVDLVPSASGVDLVPLASGVDLVPSAPGVDLVPSAPGVDLVPSAPGVDLVPSASAVDQPISIIVLTNESPGMDVANTSQGQDVPSCMEVVAPDQSIVERHNGVAIAQSMEDLVTNRNSPVVPNVLESQGSAHHPPAVAAQQKNPSPVNKQGKRTKNLKRLQPKAPPIATEKSRSPSPQIPDLSTEVYFCFRCRCFITLRLALIRAHSRKCERESRQLKNP